MKTWLLPCVPSSLNNPAVLHFVRTNKEVASMNLFLISWREEMRYCYVSEGRAERGVYVNQCVRMLEDGFTTVRPLRHLAVEGSMDTITEWKCLFHPVLPYFHNQSTSVLAVRSFLTCRQRRQQYWWWWFNGRDFVWLPCND